MEADKKERTARANTNATVFVSYRELCYCSRLKTHGAIVSYRRRRIMVKRVGTGCVAALLLFIGTPLHAQGIFEGMFDKAKRSAEQKTRDRLNQRMDQTIDQGMNKTEETVQCVATDKECLTRAKEQGKTVSILNAPMASDSVKCVATDTGCLKQAKAQGKKVEIVDEADLDTLRCAATDADCLKRAKSTGKKVEIID